MRGLFRLTRGRLVALALLGVLAAALLAVPNTRWRGIVIFRKSVGQLDSMDWAELLPMLLPGSKVEAWGLASHKTPYVVISDPFTSPRDLAAGKALFGHRCSQCHGPAARGGAGPALIGRALKHGNSDWAMYRTITKGVSGTAMAPAPLSHDDVWRVMTYLHGLAEAANAAATLPDGSVARDVGALDAVSSAQLLAAAQDTNNWLSATGPYNGRRFSPDTQINAKNVGALSVGWIHQFDTVDARIESVPVVAGRFLFMTLPGGPVLAFDSSSGAQIWRFDRPAPADVNLCCVNANRGVALLGKRLYVATLDAHLLALNAETGKLLWDTTVADYHRGYSMTSAPMAIGKTIVAGVAGGDFPTRGFVAAYDADTGAVKWRFETIPGPGEPGHETWAGDSWRNGGASTWGTGAYDPELGLLYWGVGNPAPDFNAAVRGGDNLYSNCVLALDVETGRLVWHFQFSPGDDHDWDAVQTPALIDLPENGQPRKLLAVANRNGFFYVLDRQTGQFVRAAPYVRQTWALGISPSGRPIRAPNTSPSASGTFLYPSVTGATSWWPATYNPNLQKYYVLALERGGMFFAGESAPEPAPGHLFVGSNGQYVPDIPGYTAVRAIDPRDGKILWEHRNRNYNDLPRGGLLSTAGGVIFGSDTSTFFALDANSGAQLWTFDTGGQISAAPISYRVGNRQVIAVIAGQVLLTFELPDAAQP
jgi:alcohol dehydrogenase (cytochrome c)